MIFRKNWRVYDMVQIRSPYQKKFARVAELVDALDLGSSSGDRVGVRVSPLAPENSTGGV